MWIGSYHELRVSAWQRGKPISIEPNNMDSFQSGRTFEPPVNPISCPPTLRTSSKGRWNPQLGGNQGYIGLGLSVRRWNFAHYDAVVDDMDKQKVQMGLCKINKMYKQAGKSYQTPTPPIYPYGRKPKYIHTSQTSIRIIIMCAI